MEQTVRALFDEACHNPEDGKYITYNPEGPILTNSNTGKPYSNKTVREGVNRIINQLSSFDKNISIYELIQSMKDKPLQGEDKIQKWIKQACSVISSSNRLKIKPKMKIDVKSLKINQSTSDPQIKNMLKQMINEYETKKLVAENEINFYNKMINELKIKLATLSNF